VKHRLLLTQKMLGAFLPSLPLGQESGASMPRNTFVIGAVNGIIILVNVICDCGQDPIQLAGAFEVPWAPRVDRTPPPLDCHEQVFQRSPLEVWDVQMLLSARALNDVSA
jgi:hypothetical protein